MTYRAARLILAGSFSLTLATSLRAEVKLPRVFSDNMVLQRDTPVRLWGWADPGEKVTITFAKHRADVVAGKDGRWKATLPAMKAGGPYELIVKGINTRTIKDVLVGEVWFCSGQSNMALPVLKARNHDIEIAAADHSMIRILTTPTRQAKEPSTDVEAEWRVCSPRTISYFSATAYFFGRQIHQKLDVPVGLIVSAVNGTRIEPWTPASGVESVKELAGKDGTQNGDLYNGMVHPFTSFAIRGVLWYQGEGNVGDGSLYYHRMRALINGWRKNWGVGNFPFYYVQLTPLNWGGKPVDQHAELWDAQRKALRIANTGMVVTTDIVGNVGEAHPKNKQEVGRRLALWALARTYNVKDLGYSGPLYKSMKIEGDKVRITFDHAEGGLSSRDGKPLTWFTIAGADNKFVPAQAEIDGETVVVWSDEVTEPLAVRFGWHQIAEPNLMNRHKLPASPFRTESEEKEGR
jgi:sialate O-acetylesterase